MCLITFELPDFVSKVHFCTERKSNQQFLIRKIVSLTLLSVMVSTKMVWDGCG